MTMKQPTREEMVERLVEWDVYVIKDCALSNDTEFLRAVLTGEGWVPYNQLSDDEVKGEYLERVECYGEEFWEFS